MEPYHNMWDRRDYSNNVLHNITTKQKIQLGKQGY